jgi:hypothetical protein
VKINRSRLEGRRAAFARGTALAAAVVALSFAVPAHAVDDPWAPGTSWLSVRAGYAKLAASGAPNGAAGYGFGYSRMLGRFLFLDHFSIGANAHHELLGRFGGAALIDVPVTVEIDRHFQWSGSFHPYLGIGYGPNFIKGYRFPGAPGDVRGAVQIVGGGNVPLNSNSLLGVDARMGIVSNLGSEYVWSLKLNYAWVY